MDRFTRRIEILLPKGSEVDHLWNLLEPLWKTLLQAFGKGRGPIVGLEATGSTADHRSFKRKSVIELRKAFELNHAQPRSVDLYAFAGRKASGVDFAKIFAWYGIGQPSFNISVAGPSRIDVERLSHELMESLSSSKRISAVAPQAEIVLHDLVLSSSDDGVRKATHMQTVQPGDSEKGGSIITRVRSFLREHTTAFILSVAASIVATGIIWLMFGR